MRFASLGSGSSGNALVVEAGATRLLVDCGFGLNDVLARLARRGVLAEQLDAILVTHEHDDHAGGVAKIARKFGIPVYLTYGTYVAMGRAGDTLRHVHIIDGDTPFALGDLSIHPYPVPHDAREPTQFVFSDGAYRFGLLTDTGSSTPHIERMLSGLDALMLECNHDLELLMNGTYPYPLKQRIAGRYGHLANHAAAQLLAAIDCSRLQHLIAAHLSQENNSPELAGRAMAAALNATRQWITIATQEDGFDWRALV